MRRLNQQESIETRYWIDAHRDSLAFEAKLQHTNDYMGDYKEDGDFRMEVYIAKTIDGAVGLVISRVEPEAEASTFGLLDSSDKAVEQIYTALANDGDELLRAIISTAGLGDYYYYAGLFDDIDINVSEPITPSVMRILANDSDPAVRLCIALSPLAPQTVFAMLANDADPFNRAVAAASDRATTSMLDRLSRDTDEDVRGCVARNYRTPPIVLKRLGGDGSMKVLYGIAGNPHTPSSTLHAISKIDFRDAGTSRIINADGSTRNVWITSGEIKRAIAGNPNTPAATLRELLDEADSFAEAHMPQGKGQSLGADGMHFRLIRERIAANRSTPPEMLDELSGYRDNRVLSNIVGNPSSPQSAIEKIARAIIGNVYVDLALSKAVIESPLLPVSYLEQFSFSRLASERRLVWYCSRTPRHVRQRLSYDPDLFKPDSTTSFVEKVERRRFPEFKEPRPLLEVFSLSNSPVDRIEAARDLNAPVEILKRLSYDSHALVRAAVASNKYADEETLNRLARDPEKHVRECLATNDHLPLEAASLLLGDEAESVLVKLAGWKDIPYEMLAGLASHDSRSVRAAAVANLQLPHDRAVRMALKDLPDVKKQVALRDDLSQKEYAAIMDDALATYRSRRQVGYDWVRQTSLDIIERLLEIVPVDEDIMRELASCDHRGVEKVLARDCDLLPSVAIALAESKDDQVKIVLAQNQHAPESCIRMLLDDKQEHIRWYALANPNVPREVLVEKALHGTAKEQSIAARNPSLPTDLLLGFARNQSYEIKSAAAANPNLPSEVLRELARDPQPIVRRAVARDGDIDDATLRMLAQDEDIEVRKALILRDDLPVETLRSLAASTAGDSYLAARKYAGNVEILEILARNGSKYALEGLAANEDATPQTLEWIYELRDTQLTSILVHNPSMPNVTTTNPRKPSREAPTSDTIPKEPSRFSSTPNHMSASTPNATPHSVELDDEDIPF